jgi:hypothetical protein
VAVTDDQFEAMTPQPYHQVRDQLRTGDILLFHSTGFPERAIEWGTKSLWCHAAFIWRLDGLNRVLLLESMDKVGVRCMPMSTRLNGNAADPKAYPGQLLVLRHPDFPPNEDAEKVIAMTAFALDRLGYPYSDKEIMEIAIRIAEGMAGHIVTGRLDPQNQYICSEYVAKCYDVMDVTLAPDQLGFIAPGDIARDPRIQGLFSVKPDGTAA